jgi:hypothetical protein
VSTDGSRRDSNRPIVVTIGGIEADTTNAQFFYGGVLPRNGSGSPSSADAFWSYQAVNHMLVRVEGIWTGDHINATKVYWADWMGQD